MLDGNPQVATSLHPGSSHISSKSNPSTAKQTGQANQVSFSLNGLLAFRKSLSNEIVSCARKICEYEAMTFLPDDFKEDYINVSNCIKNIIDNLKTCIRVKVDFLLENQWRIWLGILDCFIEWCVENKFATFSIEKQKELLIESPLMTFLYFID